MQIRKNKHENKKVRLFLCKSHFRCNFDKKRICSLCFSFFVLLSSLSIFSIFSLSIIISDAFVLRSIDRTNVTASRKDSQKILKALLVFVQLIDVNKKKIFFVYYCIHSGNSSFSSFHSILLF